MDKSIENSQSVEKLEGKKIVASICEACMQYPAKFSLLPCGHLCCNACQNNSYTFIAVGGIGHNILECRVCGKSVLFIRHLFPVFS
jgi:Zinc finger, C3HC4 type (RING finger)